MNIVLVTDAWTPQVNGVVTTLTTVVGELRAMGHRVTVIAPDDRFKTMPCPTYPEIRLAIWPLHQVGAMIDAARPEAVHIATEGPLGFAARRHCLKTGRPFTTAYHTKFPEYIHARSRLPLTVGYAAMRHFHGRAAGVMVATQRVRGELESYGFDNIRDWSRGVDTEVFKPEYAPVLDLPRPINMYVGRVAVEKTCQRFWSWTCLAARWWLAMARNWPNCAAGSRRSITPAPNSAPSWPPISPPPMFSFFPAAPILSAW